MMPPTRARLHVSGGLGPATLERGKAARRLPAAGSPVLNHSVSTSWQPRVGGGRLVTTHDNICSYNLKCQESLLAFNLQ